MDKRTSSDPWGEEPCSLKEAGEERFHQTGCQELGRIHVELFFTDTCIPVAPGEVALEEGIWESLVETKGRDEQSQGIRWKVGKGPEDPN